MYVEIIYSTSLYKIPNLIPTFDMIYMTCNTFIAENMLFLASDLEVIMFKAERFYCPSYNFQQ